MPTRLSVNVNKIATLRNARGKNLPNLVEMTRFIADLGVQGITLHPRPDERHILYKDVYDISKLLKDYPQIEYNIEGYPSSAFLDLVLDVKPHQCTLVPDPPDVLTSQEGWDICKQSKLLLTVLNQLKSMSIRTSLFIEPLSFNSKDLEALNMLKPDRVEFYTEPYAEACLLSQEKQILNTYKQVSEKINKIGIEINAGHDLNQNNIQLLIQTLPQIKEVSIGQALISEALKAGLPETVKKYLSLLN